MEKLKNLNIFNYIFMINFKLYDATVIDTDDTDKQGKVKIKIQPYFENIEDDGLPWAIPFIQDSTSKTLSNDLPSVGSTIRVLVSDNWKRFYYLGNRYFYNLFDFSKVSDKLSDLENINTDYKNLIFRLFEDGSLTFHNISDGSHGFIQSSGSYIYFDKNGSIITSSEKDIDITHKGELNYENDGKMTIHTKDDLSIKSDKNTNIESTVKLSEKGKSVEINSDTTIDIKSKALIDIGNDVSSIGKILLELMTDLSTLTTIGSPTNHTSPTLTAQMSTLITKLNSTFKTT